jgi:hypothetical protein
MWLAGYALAGGELQSFRILQTLQDLKRHSLESAVPFFCCSISSPQRPEFIPGIDGLHVFACRFHHNPRQLKRNLSTSFVLTFT